MRNLATLARFEQAERMLNLPTIREIIDHAMREMIRETGNVETARLVVKVALCGFVEAYKISVDKPSCQG